MSDPEQAFLLHLFHRQQNGRPVLFGVGRLESGPTFAFADNRLLPCFYLRESELAKARPFCLGVGAELEPDTGLTTMDGEPVARVGLRQPRQLRRLAEGLHGQKLRTYEADIAFTRQWLVTLGVRGPLRIGGSWRPGHGVDRVYVDPQVEPGDWEPDLRLLALDIETTPDAGRLLACSLVAWGGGGEGVEEIHLAGEPAAGDPPEVRCHATEADLLTGLLQRIRELDPDVLTGWNLVDFDLTVLQTLCRTHGVPFNLGRSTDESWYQEGDVWGGSRVVVYGRQVLDAMHLVRATLQRFEDNRLHTVALALLGRGKTFEAGEGDSMPDRILAAFRDDRAAFAGYCLEDSRLVRDILLRQDLVRLSLRRACLTGLPLERAWGSVAAFDFLYLTGLRERGMVAPTTGVDRVNQEGSPGGLVMASRVGLYRHVFVFDFKSLYPSIIRTFNIDPLTHLEAGGSNPGGAEEGSQEAPGVSGELLRAPNGALFTRRPGILPEMLAGFFEERARARAAGDELAAFTCKIVMNSFYGVLATGSCRFAEGALAGAITGFGHYLLRWTRDLLEDSGRGAVLYGDTDSLFVDPHLPVDLSAASAPTRAAANSAAGSTNAWPTTCASASTCPPTSTWSSRSTTPGSSCRPCAATPSADAPRATPASRSPRTGPRRWRSSAWRRCGGTGPTWPTRCSATCWSGSSTTPRPRSWRSACWSGSTRCAGGSGTTTSCTARPCASRWTATPAPFPPTWPRRGCCRSRGARSATSSPATARSPPAA